ncbi:hypothetical protein [Pseudomonas phage PSA09]|uniref:Uncharacterized protein n=1 Tax=Pseudomonas phage PSA09 TaxID=2833429 RepID=A0AAE7RCH7_9CAUD|nr:hypothetical protein [Pseudomonas phage PSA09]
MLEINLPDGRQTRVQIEAWSALDGWELQRRFVEFAVSMDSDFRRAFTMEILSYAKVMLGDDDSGIQLTTAAVINNHLGSWKNVELVFNSVLQHNGIDPTTHADRPDYWEQAGSQMAIAFLAEASKLIGPAMKIAEGLANKPE